MNQLVFLALSTVGLALASLAMLFPHAVANLIDWFDKWGETG